jgi:trk system potassium uptake protein TrkH
MGWFEAVCHAFSTLGTGGFSTRSASVGAFNSPAIDWVITVFMLIAGLNFGLFYGALRGRLRDLTDNYELRFYLLVNAAVILLVFATTFDRHPTLSASFRHAAFQTAAVTTTTGFMTDDFDAYPDVARFALFLCMFMGGCAGSTAGGLKASRVFALFKLLQRELRLVAQPSAVIRVRLGVGAVPNKVLEGITLYLGSYLVLFATASMAMVAFGLDLISAMTSVVACLSSVGPGLAQVGPTQNFEFIPAGGKWVLTFCMIAGRLEVLPLLAVFTREAYRH